MSIADIDLRKSNTETHSKTEPWEITKKCLLSALLKRLQPSAIFNIILREARHNGSFIMRSLRLTDFIKSKTVVLKYLAF